MPPAQVFTADCSHLALASLAGPVYLVAAATGATTHVFRSHLSPDALWTSRGTVGISLPPVTHLCVSPDRQWLAVAVAGEGAGPFCSTTRSSCVCVYSLEAQRMHAMLPLPCDGDAASPIVALAFSPLGDKLVAATAGKDIQLFDVESGQHSWSASALGAALPARLRQMPGHLCALSMDPTLGLSAVLAHTQHAVCHLDLTRTLTPDAPAAQKRRRVNLVPAALASSAGRSNGRIITLEHPCLFAGYIQPHAALLVERPWESIMRALPPPLWRHRFGV